MRREGATIVLGVSLLAACACVPQPDYEGRRCFVNDPCPQGFSCGSDQRCHFGSLDAGLPLDAGMPPADAGPFDHARCADPYHYPPHGWEVRHYRLPNDYTISEANCIGVEDLQTEEIHRDYGFGGLGPNDILFISRYTAKRVLTPAALMFTVRHDDGLRVFVDDHLYYENWLRVVSNPRTATTTYLLGGEHKLEVQHNNLAGVSYIDVSYAPVCDVIDRRTNRWALAYHRLLADRTIDRQDCFGAYLLVEDNIRFDWRGAPPEYAVRAGAGDRFALIGYARRFFNGRTDIVITHGGGLRFIVDGNMTIYEDLAEAPIRSATVTANLTGLHDLSFELMQSEGPAALSIRW